MADREYTDICDAEFPLRGIDFRKEVFYIYAFCWPITRCVRIPYDPKDLETIIKHISEFESIEDADGDIIKRMVVTDSELIAYIAECERVTCTNKYMVQVITKKGEVFVEYFDTPPSGVVPPFIHESREAALLYCLRKSRKE